MTDGENFVTKEFHAGVYGDEAHAEQVLKEAKFPCERCAGTGNEFYAMYKQCKDCGGSGVQPV